jgi:hypothetical protein
MLVKFAPGVFSEDCVMVNTVLPFFRGKLDLNVVQGVRYVYSNLNRLTILRLNAMFAGVSFEPMSSDSRIFLANCRSCASAVKYFGRKGVDCLCEIDTFAFSYRHLPFIFQNQ